MSLDNNHFKTKFRQLTPCKMSTAKQQTAISNITATAKHKNLFDALSSLFL